MATRAIAYLPDARPPSPPTTRKMSGKYAVSLHGKVLALDCDDQLFLKPRLRLALSPGKP